MGIHYTIWIPAVSLGYGLGLALLIFGLEKTSGVFSKAYRRIFGRHVGGTMRRLRLEKAGSATELTAGDIGIDIVEERPREIALMPVPSMNHDYDSANGANGVNGHPRLRSLRSKASEQGSESTDEGGLRQLRSLRSTLSAAVESFKGTIRHPVDNESDVPERENTCSGPGPIWVRGCSCETACKHKDRWTPPSSESMVQSALQIGAYSLTTPCDLSWSELSCSVLDTATHRQKHVLQGNSGIVTPGEMLALVGPSGAGKSTLLDVLAMRKGTGKLTGQVYMNGGPRGRPFKRMSAYVAQEDVFEPVLTAWETLKFHAELRLAKTISSSSKEERMTNAMQNMGLWKSRNTQVGGLLPGGIRVRGLSGGEQRRLSIACALIATPSIIFLDEPTTGLDSFAALNIMEHMSHLARQGHTIIATIHQPRAAIWAMFHKVDVLSEGYQVYFGPPTAASEWLTKIGYEYQPHDGAVSDWLMDLISVGFTKSSSFKAKSMTTRAHVSHAATLFHSEHREQLPLLPTAIQSDGKPFKSADAGATDFQRYAASWDKQIWVLYNRALVTQLRNPSDICGRIVVTTTIGLVTGLVFFNQPNTVEASFQHLNTVFFAAITYMLLPFCYMSFYVANRKFYYEEVASKLYHPTAYYLATSAAGFPFIVVNTLVGALASYGLAGLRYQGQAIVLFAIIITLTSLVAIQFLTFCVWFSPNQDIAFVAGVGYTALCILTVTYFIPYSMLRIAPMKWLSWISFPRYAMQGMAYNEYHNVNFTTGGRVTAGLPGASSTQSGQAITKALNLGFSTVPIKTGQGILNYYEFHFSPGLVIGVLVVFYFMFHLMSYFTMAHLYKHKR